MPSIVEIIRQCFLNRGNSEYGGEAVTQQEHALQCALMAEENDSPPALIAAALLHDIGHLLHRLPNDAPDQGIDDRHEELGYRFLQRAFGASVSDPVRLHVAAKRYLCSVDPSYEASLSEPSRASLALQGGNMSAAEKEAFEKEPHWRDAVEVRRWDDLAKVIDKLTPDLEHFLSKLEPLVIE